MVSARVFDAQCLEVEEVGSAVKVNNEVMR